MADPSGARFSPSRLMYSKWIYASIVPGEREVEVLAAVQDALWALKGGSPAAEIGQWQNSFSES